MDDTERIDRCDRCGRGFEIFEFPKYQIIDFKRLNYPPNLKLDESILKYEEVVPEALCLVPTEVINHFKENKSNNNPISYSHQGFIYQAHLINGEIKKIKTRKDVESKEHILNWLNNYFNILEQNIGKEVRRKLILPEYKDYKKLSEEAIYEIPVTRLHFLLSETKRNKNLRRVDMSIINLIGWGAGNSTYDTICDVGVMVYEGRLNSE